MAFAESMPSRTVADVALPAVAEPARNFFLRLFDKLAEANRLRAERAIGRYIEENGGRMTDDLERRISRRFGSSVA